MRVLAITQLAAMLVSASPTFAVVGEPLPVLAVQLQESPTLRVHSDGPAPGLLELLSGSIEVTRPESTTPSNWIRRVTGSSAAIRGAAHGADAIGPKWVVAGDVGTILRSADGGYSWSSIVGLSSGLNDVAYGNQRFVIVGHAGVLVTMRPNGAAIASSDGETTWYTVSRGDGAYWVALGARFRASSGWEDMAAVSFNDAETWTVVTVRPSSVLNSWSGVAYANGFFVAVRTTGVIERSSDGVNWSQVAGAGAGGLEDITYGAGRWVACGDGGLLRVSTLADASAWSVSSTGSTDLLGIAWGGNYYVVAGSGGHVRTSFDASSWSEATVPTSGTRLETAAAGGGEWLAGGESGVLVQTQPLADVLPVTPGGWPAPLVVSCSRGTQTPCAEVTTSDTLFCDAAILNLGPGDTGPVVAGIYFNGLPPLVLPFPQGIRAGNGFAYLDVGVIGLQGTYAYPLTLTADPDASTVESDEGNNTHSAPSPILVLSSPQEQPPVAGSMRVAPNPASATTTVRLVLPRASHVSLSIHDIAGRRVESLFVGSLPSGAHHLHVGTHGALRRLRPGTYWIRAAGPAWEGSQPLHVVR